MIVAEQKSLNEIKQLVGAAKNVLVVGCGTCVTVCFAGGSREAAILASSLRMASKLEGGPKAVSDVTVQRQCEWEYLDEIAEQVKEAELVVSLGCGIGVQAIAEHFPRRGSFRLEHQLLGFAYRARHLDGALCCLRGLRIGVDGWDLSHRPMFEIPAQRALRRVGGWTLRDRSRGALRLAVDLRSPEQHG
jgi:ferredoxin